MALGSLGMMAMFVVLLYSFSNFLIGPTGEGPDRIADPTALLIQLISISAAPGLVMAGVTFVFAKSEGSRLSGMILMSSGAVTIVGMILGRDLVQKIPETFTAPVIDVTPYFFMAAGGIVVALGLYLTRHKARARLNRDSFV